MSAEGLGCPGLTESRLRVLAALVEARGAVSEAARIIGVTKQYVYEVLAKLRREGVRLRAYPYLSALGRVYAVISKREPPDNGLLAFRFRVYGFDGSTYAVGVYVLPRRMAWLSARLSGELIEEVGDLLFAAPWLDLSEVRPREGDALPRPPSLDLDEEDRIILLHLYEDLMAQITKASPSVSKSRLSYHYRFHVRRILQALVDYHPRLLHCEPLLFAEVQAAETWLAALLRARQVYAVMPKAGGGGAYALLSGRDAYSLVRSLAEARERGLLPLAWRLRGYVDLEGCVKPRIPSALAQAGLRTP